MTSFVAIDFETANGSLASICQVGIAIYRDGVSDQLMRPTLDRKYSSKQ